jgi:hypothetical protein
MASWNELYLLRAFLAHNDAFEIVLFNHLARRFPQVMLEAIPMFIKIRPGALASKMLVSCRRVARAPVQPPSPWTRLSGLRHCTLVRHAGGRFVSLSSSARPQFLRAADRCRALKSPGLEEFVGIRCAPVRSRNEINPPDDESGLEGLIQNAVAS